MDNIHSGKNVGPSQQCAPINGAMPQPSIYRNQVQPVPTDAQAFGESYEHESGRSGTNAAQTISVSQPVMEQEFVPPCPFCNGDMAYKQSAKQVSDDGQPNPNYGRNYYYCNNLNGCRKGGRFIMWKDKPTPEQAEWEKKLRTTPIQRISGSMPTQGSGIGNPLAVVALQNQIQVLTNRLSEVEAKNGQFLTLEAEAHKNRMQQQLSSFFQEVKKEQMDLLERLNTIAKESVQLMNNTKELVDLYSTKRKSSDITTPSKPKDWTDDEDKKVASDSEEILETIKESKSGKKFRKAGSNVAVKK